MSLRTKEKDAFADEEKPIKAVAHWVPLNLLRKSRLGSAKAYDHGGDAILKENPNFQLDGTIFKSVKSPLARAALRARLCMEPYWSDGAVAAIEKRILAIPRAPDYDAGIIDFMNTDCDFAMEHADGSFMDHLQFCYEYCAAHMKTASPNVLLLHSVLGVGTNYFPCAVDKIPKLEALLTPQEMIHVSAFPSVLRLLLTGDLLRDLAKRASETIASITMHRVIDNKLIVLEADDFWLHLNYQLIHLLDFLPLLDWAKAVRGDAFLAPFAALHAFLKTKDKLLATVDYDLKDVKPSASSDKNASLSLGYLITTYIPSDIQLAIGARQVRAFSKAVGHDLSYELHYAG
ncbi:hypothetical protein CTAYLR_001387 [Chrysophaeum taylorii]|uniref:Uncharacterized protein n=1 Tax=Chrysophaeum taylorii TaxID=2483200 RepID=A0AAD7XJJ9_9STRA|nr:hypothetical protein CTAYLR_001387 [Chrysophaeum taylorii]